MNYWRLNMPSNCSESINHSRIKCEEKQSKLILINDRQLSVTKIKVDGCIYPNGTSDLRCDYAINYNNDFTLFIELKGCNLKHACNQIIETLRANKFTINNRKFAAIVTSRMPKDDSTIKKLKIQLKNLNVTLKSSNSPLECNLSDFIY